MKVSYGFDVKDQHDKWVKLAEGAVHGYAIGGTVGRFMVDVLPIRMSLLSPLSLLDPN